MAVYCCNLRYELDWSELSYPQTLAANTLGVMSEEDWEAVDEE